MIELPPLIYVGGAFTTPSEAVKIGNIYRARATARVLVEIGCYVRVPHLIGEFCDGLHSWEWWMTATAMDLEGCDAIVVAPHSENSAGTRAEVESSETVRRPVFHARSEPGRTEIVLPPAFFDWLDHWGDHGASVGSSD